MEPERAAASVAVPCITNKTGLSYWVMNEPEEVNEETWPLEHKKLSEKIADEVERQRIERETESVLADTEGLSLAQRVMQRIAAINLGY